jgi:hypothetical protein
MESGGFITRLPGHLATFSLCLVLIACCDRFAIKPWLQSKASLAKKDFDAARWFFVHALANFFVCVTGVRALFTVLCDPYNAVDSRVYGDTSMFGNASSWPLAFVNAVHVYHMLGGFKLSKDDYFHHLLFIPLLGFPGQALLWGPVEPAGACFISGFPGGISYLLLGLQKLGLVVPIVEKRVTANLNAWVRLPGILLTSFICFQGLIYGRHMLPLWALVIHVFLPPYNAIFYNKQAIANYTVHFLTSLISQDEVIKQRLLEAPDPKLKAPTGLRKDILVSWREATAVPQQGC